MNLYLISQTERDGYDTYDSAVVAATFEDSAKMMHPDGKCVWVKLPDYEDEDWGWHDPDLGFSDFHSWASHPSKVTAKLIGAAAPDVKFGVICASYNAG